MQPEQSTVLNKQAYLSALYQRYAPALFAYLHRHSGSLEDTEDLLLDVFEAALVRPGFEQLTAKEQEAWLWNWGSYRYQKNQLRQEISIH